MERKTRVMTFAINKGGTGKTTSSLITALLLTDKGFKVLVIDNDPQGNSTGFSGIEPDEETLTLEDIYVNINENTPDINEDAEKDYIMDAILESPNGYDIIPCTNALAGIENQYNSASHLFTLKRACKAIEGEYDFIIIDNPPAINTLAGCGMMAADDVIFPIEPSGSVEMSILNNVNFINTLVETTGQNIRVDRFLIIRMNGNDPELIEQVENLEEVAENVFGCKIAKPFIRDCRPLKKSFSLNSTLPESLKERKPTALFDYVQVVEEYLNDHGYNHNSFVSGSIKEDGSISLKYKIPFMKKKTEKTDIE